MNIKGKIIVALPEMSGTSKAGNPWKKREYVLENTDGQYPRQIHFDFFGDKADQYPVAVGDQIKLSFDIESREYQGRWFTSIRGWKVEKNVGTAAAAAAPAPVVGAVPPPPMVEPGNSEDLPF